MLEMYRVYPGIVMSWIAMSHLASTVHLEQLSTSTPAGESSRGWNELEPWNGSRTLEPWNLGNQVSGRLGIT